jgi:hypothetical protein
MSTAYEKTQRTKAAAAAAAAQAVVMSSYVKDEFKDNIKDAVAAQPGDPELQAKEHLFNWLNGVGGWSNGPNRGWPSFCNDPIEKWDDIGTFNDDLLRVAKAAYNKYHKLTGGKRRKRTKFNKRKSSSRVLSKSRRRTHRK